MIKRPRSEASDGSGNPAPHASPCLPHDDESFNEKQELSSDAFGRCNSAQDDIDHADIVQEFYQTSLNCFTSLPPQDVERESQLVVDRSSFADYLALDTDPPEFVLPAYLGHWSQYCPHELSDGDLLVFSVSKSKIDVVMEREYSNLTPQELREHHDEVELAKLA